MARSIEPPRAPRRTAVQELKSQLALELALHAYAVLGATVILRCLLLSLGIDDRLWVGGLALRLSDPLVLPLTLLPGSNHELVGRLTLADATVLAVLALVPIAMIARPRSVRGTL